MVRRLLSFALLVPAAASANVFESFGFGPRAVSMAGSLTADANDYTAVFYNPAMLVTRTDLNFGFSFSWFRLAPDVAATGTGKDLDCTFCAPGDAVGYTTGLLFPLAGKVKNRLALGLGAYAPSQRFLRVLAADPNRPFWYHYNGTPERFVFYAGAGIRITDELAIGIGTQVLDDLVGQGATIGVDLFSKQVRFREIDSHLSTRTGPVAGLLFVPIPALRFGVTYRHEMALLYVIPAEVDLRGIGTLAFQVSGVAHYSPHTVTAGVAWDATADLTVTVDGQWMHWSVAPSPYLDLTIDLSGETLRALGLDEALDLQSPRTPPGFADTLSGKVATEYRLSDRFAARLGATWRPTPVPRQDAPGTNIMDGSAVGIAAGVGVAFDDPLEVFQHPVKMDLATLGLFHLPREAHKEATDDVPSYRYSARVFGLTAALRYDF